MTVLTDYSITTHGSVKVGGEKTCGDILEAPEIASMAKKNSALVADPTSDVSDESEKDDDGTKLPFSKARSIALVATLTGASFLNVGSTTKGENKGKLNHCCEGRDVEDVCLANMFK
jgi:hypothetical protein